MQINIHCYAYNLFGKVTAGTRAYSYTYGGSYNADPVPSKLTRPNGSFTDYTYDDLYRLTSIYSEKGGSGAKVIYYQGVFKYNDAHMREIL